MGRRKHRWPWQVEDDAAREVIPESGFIHDYLKYMQDSNDAPVWYHLGSILTTMVAVSGRRDLRVARRDGKTHFIPQHLWSVLVGTSGDRKSAALDPVQRLIHRVNSPSVLSTDGSVEAWHDRLATKDTDGIGILHRDELAYLFDQAKRSYSSSMISWLLTCYQGGPVSRETKSGGLVGIPRVRLNILGGIPPDTLQQKTTRSDWRSGFMPRFTFWGARRHRFLELPVEDEVVEIELANWLKAICWIQDSPIIIPRKPAGVIIDWTRTEVEEKRDSYPVDAFSSLVRLQGKGFRIAAMLAASELSQLDNSAIQVRSRHTEAATRILSLLKTSTIAMFSLVGSDTAATEEKMVMDAVTMSDGVDIEKLVETCGLSRGRVQKILLTYADEGLVFAQDLPNQRRGRPKKCYFAR